ncbi:MAG: DUF1566 domain-containing protein [Desulfocapsaceae bacterium]|jgi:hypothetical protein|nr:DUF1566 domain-containing protein [Desulfocapsaceae bacterium]
MHRYFCLIFCLCFFAPLHTAQAQFCNDYMAASTPDSQLADNGDGTVTDRKTGLMWKKCVEGQTGSNCENGYPAIFSWQLALHQPRRINSGPGFAGYHDWRLPNIKELRSIVEEKCDDPAINLVRFPNSTSGGVWSGSPFFSILNGESWAITFLDGGSGNLDREVYNYFQVRLVRGGQ